MIESIEGNKYTIKVTFSDGHEITTKLTISEALKRMDRLDTLRVLTEQYTDGVGLNIFKKVMRAYNKKDNFTGIIRLSLNEKDFLSYLLDRECNTDKDIKVLKFYTERKGE